MPLVEHLVRFAGMKKDHICPVSVFTWDTWDTWVTNLELGNFDFEMTLNAKPTLVSSHSGNHNPQEPVDVLGSSTGDNAPAAVVADQTIDDVHAEDELIVSNLISTGGPMGCVSEPTGVPSAEEGLNLWGPDEKKAKAMVPDTPASTQVKSGIAICGSAFDVTFLFSKIAPPYQIFRM